MNNNYVEAMKAEPKTYGEMLDAIAPFLKPEHCDRLRNSLRTKSPIIRPTQEEEIFIRERIREAGKFWGVNQLIHFETLAHWLSCFSISRPEV